jgi:hypothetical protein
MNAPRGHVRGGWTVMPARLNGQSLALVAAMVDALSTTELLEAFVNEGRPPIPGVFDPLAAMNPSRGPGRPTRCPRGKARRTALARRKAKDERTRCRPLAGRLASASPSARP